MEELARRGAHAVQPLAELLEDPSVDDAQAAWIAGFADAAVVGSALVGKIELAKGKSEKVRQAGAFVARLKRALRHASKSK